MWLLGACAVVAVGFVVGLAMRAPAPAPGPPGAFVPDDHPHPPEPAPPDEPGMATQRFRLGPYTLQPGGDAEGYARGVPRPPGMIGIKGMRADVVDVQGNPVPHDDVHLHHIVFLNAARSDRVCPDMPERFAGSGAERTAAWLPAGYSYLAADSDRFDAAYHVMHMGGGAGPMQVFIEYEWSWVPAETLEAQRPVTPYFLDVAGCHAGSVYDVPGDGGTGSVHERRMTWEPPTGGTVVFAGGHLHDGGIDVTLRRASTGDELCRSVPGYDDTGHLHSMSTCEPMTRVERDQGYEMVSRYDNSRPWPDSMGIVLAYVWES